MSNIPQIQQQPNQAPQTPRAPQTPKNPQTPKKSAPKNPQLMRTLKYLIALVVIVALANPDLLFFLPEDIRFSMTGVVSGLIGDVTGITQVLQLGWLSVFQLAVMVLGVLFLYNLTKLILGSIKPRTQRAATLLSVANSVARYAAVLIAVFWGLTLIGVNVSTIFASLGVLALIIGFGAESLIADVVTGVFILIEDQYQVGDIVEVSGFRGTVSAITIRTTCITDTGDNIKVFNNSDMRDIVNLSSQYSIAVCDVTVGYEADLRKVRTVLETELLPDIQARFPDVFQEVPLYYGVQELGDSAVVLRVVGHVAEKNRFNAARILNEELKIGLEEHGMPAPFPQMDVHMKG